MASGQAIDWDQRKRDADGTLAEARKIIGTTMARAHANHHNGHSDTANSVSNTAIANGVGVMIIIEHLQDRLNRHPRVMQVYDAVNRACGAIRDNRLSADELAAYVKNLDSFLVNITNLTGLLAMFSCTHCGHRLDGIQTSEIVSEATRPLEEEIAKRFGNLVP